MSYASILRGICEMDKNLLIMTEMPHYFVSLADKNFNTFKLWTKENEDTYLTEIKKEVEDIIFDNFSLLYQTMKTKGRITEDVYEQLGFPKDRNYSGDTVDKADTISQETRHRAKILR